MFSLSQDPWRSDRFFCVYFTWRGIHCERKCFCPASNRCKFFIKCCKTKRISIIIHYSFTFTLLFSISSLFAKIYFTLCNSYLIFFMVSCCRILWKVISPVLPSMAHVCIVYYALRRSLSVGHVTCQSQTPTA